MKTLLFVFCLSLPALNITRAQPHIRLVDAGKNIGKLAIVCGKVLRVEYESDNINGATFLHMGAASRGKKLAVVISDDIKRTFRYKPEDSFANKEICVTGVIEEYEGNTRIIIKEQSQVEMSYANRRIYDDDKVFTKVESEARFPGGPQAWQIYLERTLNANVAYRDGAPVGFYPVTVQFIVDKEGNISNVKELDSPKACPSCGPEAVRVIKKGPKWIPATQNGQHVIYQALQRITFSVAYR